ncbi:hypothetical protein T439DRAFT_321691 [Meredithblackwellia eburnea MCA 4105]
MSSSALPFPSDTQFSLSKKAQKRKKKASTGDLETTTTSSAIQQVAGAPPSTVANEHRNSRSPPATISLKRDSNWPSRAATLTRLVLTYPAPILFAVFAFCLYLFVQAARQYLHLSIAALFSYMSRILSLPASALQPWSSLNITASVAPVTALYCSTIGLGCTTQPDPLVGGVARTAKVQASQALDLFDSVLALGKADGVGSHLHHVAIWEIAIAVKHTSALENREFLGGQLQELGDATREVKDSVIRLNSQGLNSFTWIVHEFTRLEELIDNAVSRSTPHAKIETLLTTLYSKISDDLNLLLAALEKSIRVADFASTLGGRLMGSLLEEHATIQREKESVGVLMGLVERQGWKGKQLRRDLKLADESVRSVKELRANLERARGSFLEYESNVGHFKSGFIGYHIAGHGLSAEEEITSLKSVLAEFRKTLAVAKGGRTRTLDQ